MSGEVPVPASRQSAPHLLFLAVGFPPAAKSSTFRLREIANQFADQGWRVTAVNADAGMWRQDSGLDVTLLDGLHSNIHRVELPLHRPDFETDIRSFSRERALNPTAWVRQFRRDSQESFPEPVFGAWRMQLQEAVGKIHTEDPVDLVLASCTPYVLMAAARYLYETSGVPYAIDFRDGWSIDVINGEVAFGGSSRQGRWERRVLGDALSLWVVNDPIAEHYRSRYPALAERIHVVRNGFDVDSVPPPSDAASRPLTFGHLGRISFGPDLLTIVLKAWRTARATEPLLADAHFEVVGHIAAGARRETSAVAQLLLEAADDGVSFSGPAAKADVGNVYRRWDATVLIVIGGRYMTTGKVYEYAATGLPIVAVHEPDHDATRVLDGYPLLAGPPSLDHDDIVDQFRRAARLALESTGAERGAARAFADPLERSRQMTSAVRRLAATVDPGARA